MSEVEQETVSSETVSSEQVPTEQGSAETASPETDVPANGFRSLGLSEELIAAVEGAGYTEPTPIQAETIPLLLAGQDVLGQAQTGTGKTAAFALPLLDRIDVTRKVPQVLVLAPTRELAIQVSEAFEKYAGHMRGLRVVPIYGGQDYSVQFRQLDRGVHVIVGTPGRVMDHMRRGSLKLDELQCLILDEADEMLRMGFADDVDWVLTQVPGKHQLALFSATMPTAIRQIAQKHLNQPAQITIRQRTATADTINQRYLVVPPHQKQAALARILEAESSEGVLVFVKTRSATEPLAEFLAANGHKTAALNGDVAQNRRERIVENLRRGRVDIIVATDVAARGLDVERITHVINYDLPHDHEAYVHRIGRTGRAGRSGEAILFVHPKERRSLKRLEYATRQTIEPMKMPTNRDINKQRVARFHERITTGLAHEELETFQSIVEHYQRENDVPLEKIAACLALLANGDAPLLERGEFKQANFAADSRRDSGGKGSYGSKREGKKGRRNSGSRGDDSNMQTYRIEVGKTHSVQPGNIVGAIANEAGIGSESIGKIKIFDRFSTVDLPDSMPHALLTSLKQVFVVGQKLNISRLDDSRPRPARSYEGKKSFGKKRKGKQASKANSEV